MSLEFNQMAISCLLSSLFNILEFKILLTTRKTSKIKKQQRFCDETMQDEDDTETAETTVITNFQTLGYCSLAWGDGGSVLTNRNARRKYRIFLYYFCNSSASLISKNNV